MNSKFIVIEGLEGSGKTTSIQIIAETLRCHGINKIKFTREPGGTPLAEALRILIKTSVENECITDYAELFMLYAARSQLIERIIKPALKCGVWVIGDRHDISSQAYQGGGRGIDKKLLKTLHYAVLGDLRPDLTFYMDLPPDLGLSHIQSRGDLDRIEIESLDFFERVRTRYQEIASEDANIITIDATQNISQVNAEIHTHLEQWLSNQKNNINKKN